MTRSLFVASILLAIAGCTLGGDLSSSPVVPSVVSPTSTITPTPMPTQHAPTSTPSAPPSPTLGRAIQLRPVPHDFGCDAITVPYREATLHIDVAASDQVTAIADTGTVLITFWSVGFQGGSKTDPVVRDPAGQVVAAEGEIVTIPDHAWPRMRGYFVCAAPDALYILLTDPS